MLAMFAPVVASAQTAKQPNPAPQAAAQAPAANPGNSATPKPSPSANSHRFVTSDNFYRPGTKPQPSTPAPSPTNPPAATPVTQPAAAVRPSITAPPRIVPAQPAPLNVSVPDVRVAQPAPVVPAILATPSAGSGAVTNAAVDYASGQLSVVADNAPLGFVLKLIAAKTGAAIDLAPELQNEPVVARLGPSPVREVLTALLDSPRIDYIVLGGSDDGDKLQRVVVRMRHGMGLFAVVAPRPQPKPVDPEEEVKLDQNGHLISSGKTEADPQLSQQQRMANWQKARESMRLAEVKQQEQERENDKNASPDPPAPAQETPADPPQNPPQGDPPQR